MRLGELVDRHSDVHALNAVCGDTDRSAKVGRGRSGRRPRLHGGFALGDVLHPQHAEISWAVSKLDEDLLGVGVPPA